MKDIFSWSSWQPLKGCWCGLQIPTLPGLYRIRRMEQDGLDYIGQTGKGRMTLRRRLGMLGGIYASEMPYRDPHTAAPALWALCHSSNCLFEVSILPLQGTIQWRKGLEALAISLYRQEKGKSPTVNFGRMPLNYRMSSSNNARLVRAGKRFRGGLTLETEPNHLPGIPPMGQLAGDPQSSDWCSHQWSDWVPLAQAFYYLSKDSLGLYRIRSSSQSGLLYVGEGKIRTRLNHHLSKARIPKDKQGSIFARAGTLECSWVSNDSWFRHQRLELENDLIAAHLLVTQTVPAAQFWG